jgi:hypothetical protein
MTIQKIVEERGAAYGPPSENHARTARLWGAYLESKREGGMIFPITPNDVCFLNILQKIARCMSEAGTAEDTLQDIQGFVENILIMERAELF